MTLNTRNQSKWDSLQDQGQHTIDKVLAGKATEADLSQLSKLLTEQHELAGKIFDQGVEDAKLTADTIVDKLNKERIESGKRSLTQKAFNRIFQTTFQQVMSQAIEDILGQVHDEFESQSEEIKTKIDKALEGIRGFHAPTEAPRTPTDRLLGKKPEKEAHLAETAPSEKSLMDRVLSRQDKADQQRTEVMQMIRDTAASVKDKVTSLYDRFTKRNEDDEEEKKASIWMRKLRSIFQPFKSAWSKGKAAKNKVQSLLEMIGKPLLLAVMNPALIKSITDEVSQYLNFDTISKFMSDMWDDAKKVGSDSIDWIIDKVKTFFGFGKKEKPNVKPKVDTIAQAAAGTTQTLPSSITPAQAASEIPKAQNGLEQAQKTLADAQARYKAQPTPANKKAVDSAQMTLNYWQNRVTMYTQRASQSKLAGQSVDQAQIIVTPTQPIAGPASTEVAASQTTVTQGAPAAVLNQSSVAAPRTEVIMDMPKMTPGKAFVPPEAAAEEKAQADQKNAAISQIGIGSFGFDSGDAALNILNLGMLT